MTERFEIKRRLNDFKYYSPERVEDVVSLLEEYGEKIKILASGTDLIMQMRKGEVEANYILGLKNVPGLDYIKEDKNEIMLGPLTKIETILKSDLIERSCPILRRTAEKFGTPQIRNMATVGGNICNASPAADMAIPLLTLDSTLKLTGSEGERTVQIEDFFTGGKENILDREILTEIIVQRQKGSGDFEKLGRTSTDLSKLSCGVVIEIKDGKCKQLRIALGAVASTPVRAREAEKVMLDKKVQDDLIHETVEKISRDISPISDVRSDAEYRKEISKVLVGRLLKQLVEEKNL